MSLIVSFQGQFTPYKLPPSAPLIKTEAAKRAEPAHAKTKDEDTEQVVEDFKRNLSTLNHKKSSVKSPAVSAYTKSMERHNAPSSLACARDIMANPVHVVKESSSVSSSWEKMQQKQCRHLPVTNEEGFITGLVSDRDLLRAGEKSSSSLESVMSKKVLSARLSTPVKEMALVMLHEKISCLPVLTDSNELVGMVTKSDILRFLAQSQKLDGHI